MSNYVNDNMKASFNLKAVADESMRKDLMAINERTNAGLNIASKHMFKFSTDPTASLNLSCVAMPVTSQWLLSHLITNKLVDKSFPDLSSQINSIVPKHSDEKLSKFLLDNQSKEAESLFSDEIVPPSIEHVVSDTPYLDLSSNQMHTALKVLSEQSHLSAKNVHSQSLFKSLIGSQFSAAVKNANYDMYTTPDESRRAQAEAELMQSMRKGGE